MNLVGKTLGPYKVIALVGQGAMAAVYRAEHTTLGREVALKVPHLSTRVQHEDVARFRREGRMLASIQHPGVIEIFDADEDDGVPFLAMTFVEAPTLEAVLAACPDGRLAERRVVGIAFSLLEALGAIHERGILHRDLKPSNVFVETDDRAILADFGVARPMGEHTMITADGAAVGTFLYMAPEQHVEEPLDARTDLYMAGLLMYRALCGKLPFRGSMVEIIQAKCELPHLESPRALAPDVTPAMEALLLKACARKPEARFASAPEFRAALKALAVRPLSTGANARPRDLARNKRGVVTRDLPAGMKRTSSRRGRRLSTIALVVGAFALGGLAAVLAFRQGGPTPWVALPEAEARDAAPPSASASAARAAPPRARPRGAIPDVAEAQNQMRALWPGYAPVQLELDLARFPLKPAGDPALRERSGRDLLARLGSTLGEARMRDLAERGVIFPDFFPYMVPGAKGPPPGRLGFTTSSTEGLLDGPIFEMVGKSTPQTALAMFLASAARSTDYLVNLRTGDGQAAGVTMVDLLTLVGYLTMSQPGFHEATGEKIYGLFRPLGERVSYDTPNVAAVAARARQIDALCVTHFRQRASAPGAR